MGGAAWAVAFGETGDCTVVQQFDPFDRSMDAVAIADGEMGEAFVLFIPRRYLLPGLLLKAFEPLVKVSNGLCILLLFLMMDPVPLSNGLYKGLGKAAEPDWVSNVKALDEVSC